MSLQNCPSPTSVAIAAVASGLGLYAVAPATPATKACTLLAASTLALVTASAARLAYHHPKMCKKLLTLTIAAVPVVYRTLRDYCCRRVLCQRARSEDELMQRSLELLCGEPLGSGNWVITPQMQANMQRTLRPPD